MPAGAVPTCCNCATEIQDRIPGRVIAGIIAQANGGGSPQEIRMTKRLLILIASLALLWGAAGEADAAKLGERCGGFAGIACDRGLWCEKAPGTCQAADTLGTCAKRPDICYQLYKPVCGCDGKTYSNDCERSHSRISKSHDGPC
jgi:hypothetical protein